MSGLPVIITVSYAAWQTLDRLVEEIGYPIPDLIEDARSGVPLNDFDVVFERLIFMADDAARMVSEDLPNDNIRPGLAPQKLLCGVFKKVSVGGPIG